MKAFLANMALALSAAALLATDRSDSNANPDWQLGENWIGGTVPYSGAVYFNERADGTATLLDRSGSNDEIKLSELKIRSAELTIKNAKLSTVGNENGQWPFLVLGAGKGGTADNFTTPILNIVDSVVTAGSFIAADSPFVYSTVNLKGASTFSILNGSPAAASKDNTKININIGQDATFNAPNGFFTTIGEKGIGRHVKMNVLGGVNTNDFVMDKQAGADCSVMLNIYGCARFSVSSTLFVGEYAKVNLIMRNVSEHRVGGRGDAMLKAQKIMADGLPAAAKVFIVDLKDFNVTGGGFKVGEIYDIPLVSASNLNLQFFDLSNKDSMGAFWKLAGESMQDNLRLADNTVYLRVKYAGGSQTDLGPVVIDIFEGPSRMHVPVRKKIEVGTEANKLPAWALGGFVRPAGVNPIIKPNAESIFDCPMQKRPIKWEESDTFNPAATVMNGKIYVLYRAEDNTFTGIGSRTSRIGLAESADGLKMKFRPAPVLYPKEDGHKEYDWTGGMEDPRVAVAEDGTYVMMYTGWNKENRRARLCVATSKNLVDWQKHGPAFAKAHNGKYRDLYCKAGAVVTAPSKKNSNSYVITKINGKYLMYWGEHRIFAATSDNLTDWEPLEDANGRLVELIKPRKGYFDSVLTEAGPPAIVTKNGILLLYNGKNGDPEKGGDPRYPKGAYCAGQVLFDLNDPYKPIARLDVPFFRPMEDFERKGQYGDGTVFIEGLAYHKGKWFLYYGCADSLTAVAVYDPGKKMPGDPVPVLK